MTDLEPATALGDDAARSVRHGNLSIEENTDLALASLAMRRGSARPTPFDLRLPDAGQWCKRGSISAFWTGPDQWMIEDHGRAQGDFATGIIDHCPDCSVTEQTDGFVVFEIRASNGEGAILDLMAKLVNLDPQRFPTGTATRTGLGHMSVFVIRRAPGHLAILGMRSAAATLWQVLETATERLFDKAP